MAVTTTPAAPMRSWGPARGRSVRCAWTGQRGREGSHQRAGHHTDERGRTDAEVGRGHDRATGQAERAGEATDGRRGQESAGDPLEAVEQSLEDISEEQRDEEQRTPTPPTIQNASTGCPSLCGWPSRRRSRPGRQACTSCVLPRGFARVLAIRMRAAHPPYSGPQFDPVGPPWATLTSWGGTPPRVGAPREVLASARSGPGTPRRQRRTGRGPRGSPSPSGVRSCVPGTRAPPAATEVASSMGLPILGWTSGRRTLTRTVPANRPWTSPNRAPSHQSCRPTTANSAW